MKKLLTILCLLILTQTYSQMDSVFRYKFEVYNIKPKDTLLDIILESDYNRKFVWDDGIKPWSYHSYRPWFLNGDIVPIYDGHSHRRVPTKFLKKGTKVIETDSGYIYLRPKKKK